MVTNNSIGSMPRAHATRPAKQREKGKHMHIKQARGFLLTLSIAAFSCLIAAAPAEAAKKRCSPAERQVVEIVAQEIGEACPCDRQYANIGQYETCVAQTSDFLLRMAGLGEGCKHTLKAGSTMSRCTFGESLVDAAEPAANEL